MYYEHLISTVTGGALVLFLARFVFARLVKQVDHIADTLFTLQISVEKLVDKAERIDKLEDRLDDGYHRITRLETLAKMGH